MMGLICAATILINLSSEPWDSKDSKIFKRAKYVCSNDFRYKNDTPCLKSFTKKDDMVYNCICGPKT